MNRVQKIYICCLILLSCPHVYNINAQVLRDSSSFRTVAGCVDDIYNLHFVEARYSHNLIKNKYPEYPGVYLLDGMIRYWENYPLIPGTSTADAFVKDLRKSIELSELKHNPEDETEYLLTDLCARGLLLLFYSDNNVTSEVFPLAMSTYPYLRKAFGATGIYNDFYFFTGLYNYYREAYPEAHPVYKALAFLFPKGNKARGLIELQIAGNNSLVLKAESFSFLTWLYTNYENDYRKAAFYSKKLSDLYPENTVYLASYIKNLLLIKNYDAAERIILEREKDIESAFFKAETEVFRGILQEKKYHNYVLAEKYYGKGIVNLSPFCSYGNEYAAYAYFGLSRISESKGDNSLAKSYHKKAIELAASKKVDFND